MSRWRYSVTVTVTGEIEVYDDDDDPAGEWEVESQAIDNARDAIAADTLDVDYDVEVERVTTTNEEG